MWKLVLGCYLQDEQLKVKDVNVQWRSTDGSRIIVECLSGDFVMDEKGFLIMCWLGYVSGHITGKGEAYLLTCLNFPKLCSIIDAVVSNIQDIMQIFLRTMPELPSRLIFL
jgi:hypothetical protein